MQDRLIEIAKELDSIAKEKKCFLRISASMTNPNHGEPEVHITSRIDRDYDIEKPYETVWLKTLALSVNDVKVISDAFYFKNTEEEKQV